MATSEMETVKPLEPQIQPKQAAGVTINDVLMKLESVGNAIVVFVLSIVSAAVTVARTFIILYRCACLLYQYPNASGYALDVTWKSLRYLYRHGYWHPLDRWQQIRAFKVLKTVVPSAPPPRLPPPITHEMIDSQTDSAKKLVSTDVHKSIVGNHEAL